MSPVPPFPTVAERRERLALACELDRLRLRMALRPLTNNGNRLHGLPESAVGKAFALAQLIPGRIGHWSRRLAIGADLFRSVRQIIH